MYTFPPYDHLVANIGKCQVEAGGFRQSKLPREDRRSAPVNGSHALAVAFNNNRQRPVGCYSVLCFF